MEILIKSSLNSLFFILHTYIPKCFLRLLVHSMSKFCVCQQSSDLITGVKLSNCWFVYGTCFCLQVFWQIYIGLVMFWPENPRLLFGNEKTTNNMTHPHAKKGTLVIWFCECYWIVVSLAHRKQVWCIWHWIDS